MDKSDADRDFLSALTGPDLSYLTNNTSDENAFSNSTRNASNTAYSQINTNRANARMEMVIAENAANVAAATAWKTWIVSGVSLPEGQSADPIHKHYKDTMALVNRDAKTAYGLTSKYLATANATAVNDYLATENTSEHTLAVQQAARDDAHADSTANLYKQMQLDYQTAESDVRIDGTAADNLWRLTVSNQTVVSHRRDLVARGNSRRTLANSSLSLADQTAASIAEERVNWWDTQIVHYQQWNQDISTIETNYTSTVTSNANHRKAALMAAELDLVDETSDANRDYDQALSTANNSRLIVIRAANLAQVQAEANAKYQLGRTVAEADYQLTVTGNQANYDQAVADAKTLYDSTIQAANAAHEAAVKAATEQQNDDVAQAAVARDAAIATAQRDYDDIVAALNLQYGPGSALGDTGLERIQRDTQLAQRDSQYVAQQESSWASHLTGSTTIGNNPWSIKATATALARSQHASAMHSSLVARDQVLLNAVEDLRETIGGSEADFAGVQALLGETFQNATSAAFAAWDEAFGNVLGQVPRVLRIVDPMLDAHDIALGAFTAGEVFTASRDVGAISFGRIADGVQDAHHTVGERPAAAPERPTDNGNAEDLAKKKEEELKKAKEDEFVVNFRAVVMPAVSGDIIPMDDPFTSGFIKGFFLDGIGGDVQAVVDFANDPLKTARDTFNAMKYAESIAIGAVASLFTMTDSQRVAVAKAADHVKAEAAIWTSLIGKLATGQGELTVAEINKVVIITQIANVIAAEVKKAISDITPEDLGRIAGMIAYELAIETGITVAGTVTAGATTSLSAARIAALAQKLKRIERYRERFDDLLKKEGALFAKLTELFSELKAHGKLNAAKHLELLKIKCFSRDTLVHTATGPRPIGEIEPGEQIWSYHFERGGWGLCEVKERLDNTYSGPVVSITVDNTTIEATAYHPFWVIDGRDLQERSKPRELQEHEDEGHSLPGRWVNSHELRAGDWIITRSGTRAIITEIRQRFDDAFPVCNLSIIGHHNYAVGDVGVLVHNESVCDETIAELREYHAAGFSKDEIRAWLQSQTKDGKRKYEEAEIDKAMDKILAQQRPHYPANPDHWTPPFGWTETNAGAKTGGKHRQWKDENGNIRRRWDREGREAGKERGPHWHDYDDPSGGNDHIDPDG